MDIDEIRALATELIHERRQLSADFQALKDVAVILPRREAMRRLTELQARSVSLMDRLDRARTDIRFYEIVSGYERGSE